MYVCVCVCVCVYVCVCERERERECVSHFFPVKDDKKRVKWGKENLDNDSLSYLGSNLT